MMGIATGDMPNVDLIWALQQQEGFEACFGSGRHCPARNCHWRKSCLALDFHENIRLPIAPSAKPVPARISHKLPLRVKPKTTLPAPAPISQVPITNTGLEKYRCCRRSLNRLAPPNALPPLQKA